jgi:cephalosporin hydroxylase
MYTREEFEEMRLQKAKEMAGDIQLSKDAYDVFARADSYNWIHQTNWLGEPSLQSPQDLILFQEMIYKTKPRYIIEVGVAWAGSILFYATLLDAMGIECDIIGLDIYIPEDLKERIYSHSVAKRIRLINASSIEQSTVDEVKNIIGDHRDILVHLDSHHTHEHVLSELRLYSPLVGKGYYMVCGDTVVEQIPEQTHRDRPWGKGNNPKTALDEFMAENDRFVVDMEINNKILFSNQPGGYLICVKD